MQITVEHAELQHLEQLFKIERECFTKEAFTKEQIERLLKEPNSIGLLAKAGGEIAGFIIGIIENNGQGKTGHVYTIDVALKHRRKGIGTKLITEIEEAFKKKGATNIYLEVRVDNEPARRLYRQLGYAETEPIKDYYSVGGHGLRLSKSLSQ